MCYSFSHSAEPDEDGITDMSIINTHAYDDLSDNQFYLNFDITFTFDNYEAANKFYKEEKEEKKYKDKEIKITEDIDNQETEVNINKYVLVSQNVRDFIHKLQNDGYECKTGTSDEEE